MDQTLNSDLEMAASSCFSSILNEIQLSNLNFKIEMTPFAAFIILKKTVLKDKNGLPANPSPPILFLLQQAYQVVENLRNENEQLKKVVSNHGKTVDEITFELEKKNELLVEHKKVLCEMKLVNKNLELKSGELATLENIINDNKVNSEHLERENRQLAKSLKTKEKEIVKLEGKVDNLTQSVTTYKIENKTITAEKNKAVKEKVKLEKKLSEVKLSKSVKNFSTNTESTCMTNKSTNTATSLCSKFTNIATSLCSKSTNTDTSLYSKSPNTMTCLCSKSTNTAMCLCSKSTNTATYLCSSKSTNTATPLCSKSTNTATILYSKPTNTATNLCTMSTNSATSISNNTTNSNSSDSDCSPLSLEVQCLHIPQCLKREPNPPPFGPRSQQQTELDCKIVKQEVIQSFIEDVLEFLKKEETETLADTVEKLKALKNLFEAKGVDASEFDSIIETAKRTQEAIEELHKEDDEYSEDYFDDLLDDDLPRYYWGGEDGNEIIFED